MLVNYIENCFLKNNTEISRTLKSKGTNFQISKSLRAKRWKKKSQIVYKIEYFDLNLSRAHGCAKKLDFAEIAKSRVWPAWFMSPMTPKQRVLKIKQSTLELWYLWWKCGLDDLTNIKGSTRWLDSIDL